MPGPTTHPESKNLWFRMAVPERLRSKVGKREIRFSLGTANAAEGKLRQAQEQAKWRARFKQLEQEIEQEAVAHAPKLVDRFLEDMAARNGQLDNVIYALQNVITMRLMIAWGRDEFVDRRADRAFAYMPNRKAWPDVKGDVLQDVIPDTDRDEILARIDLFHRKPETLGAGFEEALDRLLVSRRWDAVRIEILMIEDHGGVPIPAGGALFNAVAESLLRRLVSHRPRLRDEKALAFFSGQSSGAISGDSAVVRRSPDEGGVSAREGRSLTQPAGMKGKLPLSAALDKWIELRAPRPQSQVEATRAVERFIELHGDLAIERITRDHVLEFRDILSRMPPNLNLKKLRARGKSLRDVVAEVDERAADKERRRLSPGAIKKDVGVIGAILSLLKNEGWISDNVAAGVSVQGYSKTRRGQRVPRLPLRPGMMVALFASPLFTGCAGRKDSERAKPGPLVYQDELYWSYLFGATAGPRLEEVGQVKLGDIEVLPQKDGPPIVAIYVTGTGVDESIKNDESSRVILVHPRLLELGFLEYVQERRKAGATQLFDLRQSATGKWTKELSRRVNRYFDRTVTDDPRFVFHSLRHEFKDRAEWTISTRVHDRITGHAPSTAGGRYGYGAPLELMARELEKLDVDFVDWERLKGAAAASPSLERHGRSALRAAGLPLHSARRPK